MARTTDERLDCLMEQLEKGTQNIFESGRYAEYLAVMSKFHHYSFRNTILIFLQNPNASHVAGFHAWKKDFGRSVKAGEHGIQILAPCPKRKWMDHDKIDPATGLPVKDENGNTMQERTIITIPRYRVVTHKSHKGCFGHYIRAVVLEQLVLQNLQRVIAYVQEDENEFAQLVMRNQTAAQEAEQMQTRRLLEKNTRRMNELDTIIQRLYEDNISGKLTDERFKKLSEAYEQEQTALRESVPALAAQLQDADDKMLGVQHFLKAVRKYTQPEKLTAAMLRELVEKVVVYAPDKSSGNRVQRIDVYYTFIGKIDFSPEYSKKGTA